MPLATLSATITATGISAPSYADILQDLQTQMQTIYGTDVYIAADSQDGQFLAAWAKSISDANDMAIAVYNAFSPSYAIGTGLSRVVKINGISRAAPSSSTAVGMVTGTVGSEVVGGVVQDDNGNLWDLPASVVVPLAGEIEVTATARDVGATAALAGAINRIYNPQLGWHGFVNTADAVVGEPVETDAQLRRHQSLAVARSAKTPAAAMLAAIIEIGNVTLAAVYENYTAAPDSNGLPAHSISAVVEGGDLTEIATTIGQKKTPGAATYGTTVEPYTDPNTAINYIINFFVSGAVNIKVNVEGEAGDGYSSVTADDIKTAVALFINELSIGEEVAYSRMYAPAYLNGTAAGSTYTITTLQIAIVGDPFGIADIPVAFNKAAACAVADITVTII